MFLLISDPCSMQWRIKRSDAAVNCVLGMSSYQTRLKPVVGTFLILQ
jgi:hypothetical protein